MSRRGTPKKTQVPQQLDASVLLRNSGVFGIDNDAFEKQNSEERKNSLNEAKNLESLDNHTESKSKEATKVISPIKKNVYKLKISNNEPTLEVLQDSNIELRRQYISEARIEPVFVPSDIEYYLTKNVVRTSEQNENARVYNSWPQKAQKTCASKTPQASKGETMVQVGGGDALPPIPQSVQVSTHSSESERNVSRVPVTGKPPSHPVVSALSKVSSVRIIPSPVTTPTPSVISGDNRSSQARLPFSLSRRRQSTPTRPEEEQTQTTIENQEAPNQNTNDDGERRVNRERRRRQRHRERRNQRNNNAGQTDIPEQQAQLSHLPDLLNSHVPPPYSTLPSGPRMIPPPLPIPIPPPGAPMPPFQPPSPMRRPPWQFFGSRRSRGSVPYLMDEEAKSCCGLLVTQAVSIRWFIIMIAFVGLCCTVVGTVLGAVKTNNSEYVTITLLMIGVGIVLITVSGVAWHLTSRDAPCRVMLGLAPSGRGDSRRFMRMPPPFRHQPPYAAMMYPEFQFRPPPPSYQASMQEYRLRLLLLDRQNGHHVPPPAPLPSPPPNYRTGNFLRPPNATNTQESDYSRPPSYRSREGSVNQVSTNPSVHGANGTLRTIASHSHSPSCLSFLSHDSLYSTTSRTPKDKPLPIDIMASPSKKDDDNLVTIVQSTDSSQVIGNQSVVVTVPGISPDPAMAVLAHL